MNEEQEDIDPLRDHWIASWDQQCINEIESETTHLQEQIQKEHDVATQKLWLSFQNAATAIAQLYKDHQQGISLWFPFQASAGAVTCLYKESVDAQRRSLELGTQVGYHRRNKDIVAWVKRRRQVIHQDELLAFLAGKTLPAHGRGSLSPNLNHHNRHDRTSAQCRHLSGELRDASEHLEEDLHTFKEAIALSSLNGAMSNISVGYRPHAPSSPTRRPSGRNGLAELNSFICDEINQHGEGGRKRSSSTDIRMDSPTSKRSRFM